MAKSGFLALNGLGSVDSLSKGMHAHWRSDGIALFKTCLIWGRLLNCVSGRYVA